MHEALTLDPVVPRLKPFADLGESGRRELIRHARTIDLKPGQKVYAREEYRHLVFLLKGRMVLAHGDKAHTVEDDDPAALEPLFAPHDYRTHAVAARPSTLVRFDRNVYETQLNCVGDAMEVGEVDLTAQEGELLANIFQKAQTGELALPQLPDVALHLQEAIDEPDIEIRRVTEIVERDPSTASRLLSVANSPAMGSRREITRLGDAIARLGLERTRQLVLALAAQQVFIDRQSPYRTLMEQLWRQSTRISAIAFVLADESGAADRQRALLAGLLHRVGALPVLGEIASREEQPDAVEVEHVIQRLESMTGELVAQQWGLASDIMAAIRDSGGPEQPDAAPLTDIVRIARNACLRDASEVERARAIPLENLQAIRRLGFTLDENGELAAVEKARPKIEALMQELA
ncbi:HDOD domain-containing protein [Thioalkalivibrio halophilus]|uniref:HDOD domain-containing protein n=1 Tax=Thioalkalivibrio halophilus TaxID=252474 RepID=A0A1V2ZWQ8_9GAMM|nr:HDOD domain-containing protein [Thioalkalivibrio halophilus]OOC09550.1 HDOD domain-containing protein [Thioalkalivibrio halophilus]